MEIQRLGPVASKPWQEWTGAGDALQVFTLNLRVMLMLMLMLMSFIFITILIVIVNIMKNDEKERRRLLAGPQP